jgi:predicted DNA-binding ribbon-helix-helix protein
MSKGNLRKRSMRVCGHRTSIALEPEFWLELERIAAQRGLSLPRMIAHIDETRVKTPDGPSLASAVRVFVLVNRV